MAHATEIILIARTNIIVADRFSSSPGPPGSTQTLLILSCSLFVLWKGTTHEDKSVEIILIHNSTPDKETFLYSPRTQQKEKILLIHACVVLDHCSQAGLVLGLVAMVLFIVLNMTQCWTIEAGRSGSLLHWTLSSFSLIQFQLNSSEGSFKSLTSRVT